VKVYGADPGNSSPRLRRGSPCPFDETEDILKPFVQKSRSGKTTYSYPQRFYHKITNVTLVSADPDPDLLLDL